MAQPTISPATVPLLKCQCSPDCSALIGRDDRYVPTMNSRGMHFAVLLTHLPQAIDHHLDLATSMKEAV
jgi:hypothetical protein